MTSPTAPRPRFEHDLVIVTDPTAPRGDAPYLEALRADELAGRFAIHLRDHEASDDSLRATLRRLQPLARAAQVPLVVGAATLDRARLALDEGADGVHLPERGPAVSDVRALRGEPFWIGASLHDAEGALRDARLGLDYAVLGPLRPLEGKAPPPSERVLCAVARTGIPLLALGGVRSRDDVRFALDRGFDGVAVRAFVAQAPSGAEAVSAVRAWLDAEKRDRASRAR